jgi:hypothetical protein
MCEWSGAWKGQTMSWNIFFVSHSCLGAELGMEFGMTHFSLFVTPPRNGRIEIFVFRKKRHRWKQMKNEHDPKR